MTFLKTLFARRASYVAVSVLSALASGHFLQSHASQTVPDAATVPVAFSENGVHEPVQVSRNCTRSANVGRGVAGMLRVVLSAPCDTGKITLAQGPLAVDWLINQDDAKHLSFTPLADDHPLLVTWPDGKTTEHVLPEPRDDDPFRVALAWKGEKFLTLNANAFGANAQTVDDVSPELAVTADQAGGFLTRLGDGTGRQADVYTFPRTTPHPRGVVRITVSAPVTIQTCGRTAKATALQTDVFGDLTPSAVDIALPDCDAVGQTLVLKNLFRDLRLAAN